jgi:hypothetical protein
MFCEHCGSGPKCIVCGRNDLRQAVPTARFWQWVNGDWVKLSLRAGESRTWSRFWHTQEGWSSEGARWTHSGDRVTRQSATDGTDCDGRHEWAGEDECPLDQLAAYKIEAGGIFAWVPPGIPEWRVIGARHRDHFAEAAGY